MTILHSALYDANSHKPGYIQSGDPGAVGAGIVWVDTSGGTGLWVIKVRDGTDTGWEVIYPPDHASGHLTGGSDEIDGDKLDIDWTPSNYTPSTTPTEADNADNLTAHLYGIDQALSGAGGGYDVLLYRHTATQNTGGGSSTSGSWQTVPLTEETADSGNHGSLSSNQITLDAGTYIYMMSHQFVHGSGGTLAAQLRLYNVTDTAYLADTESMSTTSSSGAISAIMPLGVGRFTIDSQDDIEIRYYVDSARSTTGLGYPTNITEEVYGYILLFKEA